MNLSFDVAQLWRRRPSNWTPEDDAHVAFVEALTGKKIDPDTLVQRRPLNLFWVRRWQTSAAAMFVRLRRSPAKADYIFFMNTPRQSDVIARIGDVLSKAALGQDPVTHYKLRIGGLDPGRYEIKLTVKSLLAPTADRLANNFRQRLIEAGEEGIQMFPAAKVPVRKPVLVVGGRAAQDRYSAIGHDDPGMTAKVGSVFAKMDISPVYFRASVSPRGKENSCLIMAEFLDLDQGTLDRLGHRLNNILIDVHPLNKSMNVGGEAEALAAKLPPSPQVVERMSHDEFHHVRQVLGRWIMNQAGPDDIAKAIERVPDGRIRRNVMEMIERTIMSEGGPDRGASFIDSVRAHLKTPGPA